jgi:hypothetical protein
VIPPATASASVDQFMAAIRESDRRARLSVAYCVLPSTVVDTDPVLSRLVMEAHHTAMTERIDPANSCLFADPHSPTDSRPCIRWVRTPSIGWLIKPGDKEAHIDLARRIAPAGVAKCCDRCGRVGDRLELVIADTPPHLLVIVLDEACVDELGVERWSVVY